MKNKFIWVLFSLILLGILFWGRGPSAGQTTHSTPSSPRIVTGASLESDGIEVPPAQARPVGLELPSELTTLKGAESLPQNEQQSLARAFSLARHEIRPLTERQRELEANEGAHFFAQNPRNQIVARFTDEGIRLGSGYPNREWEGTISLAGEQPLEIRQAGSRIEYAYENVVEWYHNKPEGIQQGWILEKTTTDHTDPSSPEGYAATSGTRIFSLRLEGLTAEPLAEREDGSSDLQFVNKAGEPVLAYTDLKVWDANGVELEASMEPADNGFQILVADAGARYPITIDPVITSQEQKLFTEAPGLASNDDNFGYSVSLSGNTVLIGANGDDEQSLNTGSAYVFVRSGDVWSLQARLRDDNTGSNNYFGNAVSLDGDTAIIGARGDSPDGKSNAGSAYVFTRSGSVWTQQQKLTAADASSFDQFGMSVSLDGETALIGASRDSDHGSNSGSAYVFVLSGSAWSQEQKLTASDAAGNDRFGISVSISGDTALIGAYQDDDKGGDSGSAYVFTRAGSAWSEEHKLTPADSSSNDNFGFSVSLDTNTALIGMPKDSGGGSVYVFTHSGITWSLEQILTQDDGEDGDEFGISVSLDGDTSLIGARRDHNNAYDDGSAYVFTRSGVIWNQQQKLVANDAATNDYFGISVSVDGDTAVVGAHGDDDYGNAAGSSSVFFRSESVWSLQQKVTPGNGAEDDYFGFSVCISANTAVIGSPLDDDLLHNSGSAYVFSRVGTIWSQEAKLIADDSAEDDHFGHSVSVSGDTVLVGAPEDGDYGADMGSAYVFVRNGMTWSQQQKLTASDGGTVDHFGWSVSIDGDTALIGAYRNVSFSYEYGAAYVFTRSENLWSEQQKLTAEEGTRGGEFGTSVSLDGDTALIGEPHGDIPGVATSSGFAYVFTRIGSQWIEHTKLAALDAGGFDQFGISVSISGDSIIIGAPDNNDNGSSSGSAYIFMRTGGIWCQVEKLVADEQTFSGGDKFGTSVSVSGSTAIIGAPYEDDNGSNAGAVYVFAFDGTDWSQEVKLTTVDGDPSDLFGNALSLDGDTALIGAYLDDVTDPVGGISWDEGSAYVFRVVNDNEISSPFPNPMAFAIPPTGTGISTVSMVATIASDPSGPVEYYFENITNSNFRDWSTDAMWDNTGLSAGTYSYRVKARDSEGNETAWSCVVKGSPGNDIVAPSPNPITLAIPPFGNGSATVTMIAMTASDLSDPVEYYFENTTNLNFRDWSTDTTWNDTGLSAGTYGYRVKARDSEGNETAWSGVIEMIFDNDLGSSAWQLANGFDPIIEDVYILDTDWDGDLDILEIFQGTDRDVAAESYGLKNVAAAVGIRKLSTTYRRSTSQTAVNGVGQWSRDLLNWHTSGESDGSITVTITETANGGGTGYEYIDVNAQIMSGTSDCLFYRLHLTPNEP